MRRAVLGEPEGDLGRPDHGFLQVPDAGFDINVVLDQVNDGLLALCHDHERRSAELHARDLVIWRHLFQHGT